MILYRLSRAYQSFGTKSFSFDIGLEKGIPYFFEISFMGRTSRNYSRECDSLNLMIVRI
jgi:hypothetical protein